MTSELDELQARGEHRGFRTRSIAIFGMREGLNTRRITCDGGSRGVETRSIAICGMLGGFDARRITGDGDPAASKREVLRRAECSKTATRGELQGRGGPRLLRSMVHLLTRR